MKIIGVAALVLAIIAAQIAALWLGYNWIVAPIWGTDQATFELTALIYLLDRTILAAANVVVARLTGGGK